MVLVDVRENQGLTELHMRLEFDESLPAQRRTGKLELSESHLSGKCGRRATRTFGI